MAVLIEDCTQGRQWGVSLTSSNPDPADFLECWDEEEAVALLQFVEALPAGAKLFHPSRLKYQVFFVLQETKVSQFQPVIEKTQSLGHGRVACWSVVSSYVDFSDFERKGSVGIDGYFIHDDDRAGGDCVVFQVR